MFHPFLLHIHIPTYIKQHISTPLNMWRKKNEIKNSTIWAIEWRHVKKNFSILVNQYYTYDDEKVWIIQIIFHIAIRFRVHEIFHFILYSLMLLFNNGCEGDNSKPFLYFILYVSRHCYMLWDVTYVSL